MMTKWGYEGGEKTKEGRKGQSGGKESGCKGWREQGKKDKGAEVTLTWEEKAKDICFFSKKD